MIPPEIIERFRKVMALALDAATPQHERNAALRHAEKMRADYPGIDREAGYGHGPSTGPIVDWAAFLKSALDIAMNAAQTNASRNLAADQAETWVSVNVDIKTSSLSGNRSQLGVRISNSGLEHARLYFSAETRKLILEAILEEVSEQLCTALEIDP